jgi:hypothetical protein
VAGFRLRVKAQRVICSHLKVLLKQLNRVRIVRSEAQQPSQMACAALQIAAALQFAFRHKTMEFGRMVQQSDRVAVHGIRNFRLLLLATQHVDPPPHRQALPSTPHRQSADIRRHDSIAPCNGAGCNRSRQFPIDCLIPFHLPGDRFRVILLAGVNLGGAVGSWKLEVGSWRRQLGAAVLGSAAKGRGLA